MLERYSRRPHLRERNSRQRRTHGVLLLLQLLQRVHQVLVGDIHRRLALPRHSQRGVSHTRTPPNRRGRVALESPTHHVVDGAHVAHVVGEQRAHLLLPPVCCGVQRRPAVGVPAVYVHFALQQHPKGEQALKTIRRCAEEKTGCWRDAHFRTSM